MRYLVLSFIFVCPLMGQDPAVPMSTDWSQADSLYFHRNVGENLERAISLLKTRLGQHPEDAQALWRLGRSLEKLGERQKGRKKKLAAFGEAERALKRSIELDPNVVDSHFFLGITLGRIGQTRGILKSLFLVGPIRREMRKTLEIDPKHGGAHHVLGEMLRQIPGFAGGSKKQAVEKLEKAIELDPNTTTHYPALAQAYLDAGKPERAKAALQKIFEVKEPADPAEYDDDIKEAKEMLARLGSGKGSQ